MLAKLTAFCLGSGQTIAEPEGSFEMGVHRSGPTSSAVTVTVTYSGTAGTSVTITGTNFGVSEGTSTVEFAGTEAEPSSWSETSIVAPAPAARHPQYCGEDFRVRLICSLGLGLQIVLLFPRT